MRPLFEVDLDAFAAGVAESQVMGFLRHGVGLSHDETKDLSEDDPAGYNNHGHGYWAIEDAREGEFLGASV